MIPEADFPTWCGVFCASIEPGGAFWNFFDDCSELIMSVITENSLPEAIQGYTRQFIGDTIPRVVNALLDIMSPTDDEIERIVPFFECVVMLSNWAVARDEVSLFALVSNLLDDSRFLYTHWFTGPVAARLDTRRTPVCFMRVLDSFVYNNFPGTVVDRLRRPDRPPLLWTFFVLFDYVIAFGRNGKSEEARRPFIESIPYLNTFVAEISDVSKLRTLDPQFPFLFSRFFDAMNALNVDDSQALDIGSLMNFAEFCLRSGLLKWEMLGLVIFHTILESTHWPSVDQLAIFLVEKEVTHFLVDQHFYGHVFSLTHGLFGFVAARGLMNDSLIYRLWTNAGHDHSADREMLRARLYHVFHRLDDVSVERFLFEQLTFSDIYQHPDLYTWIVRWLLSREVGLRMIRRLLTFLKEPELSVVWIEITDMVHWGEYRTLEGILIPFFARITRELLGDEKNWPFLDNCCALFLQWGSKELIPELLKVMPVNSRFVFAVLPELVLRCDVKISREEVQLLIPDFEQFLRLCCSLMYRARKSVWTIEALVFLEQKAMRERISPDASVDFANALSYLTASLNLEIGNLVSDGHTLEKVRFRSFLVHGSDLIFELYIKSNIPEVVNIMESVLDNIWMNGDASDAAKHFWEFLAPRLSLYQHDNVKLFRSLKLLLRFLSQREGKLVLEDFGYVRHDKEDKLLTVTVIRPVSHTFHLNKNARHSDLLRQMRDYWGYEFSGCSFTRDGFVLSHDSVIAAGSQIIEFTSQTELPVLERQSPLTVLVAESAFADWLIQFFGNSEVEQLVWDILQLLPTAQSVENEFDNVGHIIDILASPLPRFAFRYRFQPLRLFLARDPAANHEFCEKGLEILIRNLLTSPDLSLFRCLQVFEDKHWIPFIPTVLPKLLGLMNMDFEDVFMNEVVTLAWALAQADVRSFQHALALNFDVLEEIVMKDNHTTFTPVEEFVKDFENPFPFFERMVARLSVDSPGSLFAVLQGLTEQLRPSHDLTILTDQCQRILRTAETSKITRVFDLMKVLQCCDQDLLKELIQKAFENGNGQFLRSVLSLLKHQQQNLVEPFLDVQLGRYQYDPDLEKKNFFVGLRNLGATCYMNSVLQQLFGINAFLNQVLQYQFDKRDGRELQRLFVRLLLSDRKFADTQSFVAVWEGWGNSTVNPREQQDVNEFFELFLDSMPVELRQLFKGKIIHRFDGITEDFHSSTLEEFTAFGLPVRGYDDIDYPLRAFIDVETFTGFYAEDLGRKIDVRKTSRIQEPPEILVVHLRRFEYDHARRQRVKINDDCIFPQVLLMNEFTSDPKTECIYHLRGIILHTGTAQGGHYRSLMRVDDNWFEFSDCEVTSCPELSNSSTFDENLRALYCRNETACYLLFYEKNPQTKRETRFIPKDLEREVLDDNKEFWKIQNLFSNVFYSFIFECDSPILLTKYFWTVFCHSSRIQDLPVMAAELRRCIRDRRAFADFVINHAEAVTDAISSVSDQDVMNELTNLVHEFLSVIPLEKRFPFYDGFVAKFGTIMNLWRNAITLGGLPSMFVQHSECAKLAVSRKWPEICSELIQKFYQITTCQFVLQRVDFTQLLSILQRCRQYIEDPEPIFQPLIAIRHLFIQSSAHKPKFVDAVLHDRDLAALLSRILSGKSNVGDVSSELFATNFDVGDACELVKAWLAQVRGRDGPVTEVLITNYHELVVPLLLSPSPEVRWNAENLTYDLMPAAKPPRCRFNEFCRKGIWNPRVDCAERGKQLSDDRLLQILLEKSIPFVVEITNLASSAYGSRLQSFLSVLRWLVKRLGRLDGCVFASVWDLYGNLRDCNCHEDFNFVTYVQTILVFPPALVEPVFQSVAWNCFEKFPTFVEDLYSPLFTKCKQLSTGAVIGALHKSEMHDVFRTATASKAHGMIDLFRHVLPILMPSDARFRDCVFERMAELLQEPSFPAPILSLAGVAFPFLGRREIAKLCEMAIKWSNPELFTILGAQIQARADLTFDSISVDCSRIRVDDQNAEFLAVLCHRCPQFSGSAAQSGSAADFLLKVFRTADECEKFVEDGIVPTISRETPAHVFGGLREAARQFGRPRWAVSVAHEAIASGVSADSLRGLVGDLVADGEFADEVVALVVQLVEQVSEVAVTLAGRPLELLAEIVAAADCHSKELIRTLIDDQISEEQVATLSDMWPAECTRVLRDSM